MDHHQQAAGSGHREYIIPRVIDAAIVELRTMYAAVGRIDGNSRECEVFAVILLLA